MNVSAPAARAGRGLRGRVTPDPARLEVAVRSTPTTLLFGLGLGLGRGGEHLGR